MASFSYLCLFSLLLFHPTAAQKLNSTIFPIRKDDATLQYYTEVDIGTPQVYVKVVIDLGGQILWFDCDDGYTSSTYRPIHCGSTKCAQARGIGCLGCNGPARPGCANNTCAGSPYNPFENLLQAGGLGEDLHSTYLTDGNVYLNTVDVPRYAFSCASTFLLKGLANETKGMVGLARNQMALPTQLAVALNFSRKFALCIPSPSEFGTGNIFIGDPPYYLYPYPKDMSTSPAMITTSLIINSVSTAAAYTDGEASDEYFIGVKSIKVDGRLVRFNSTLLSIDKVTGVGGTKLSTVNPYTVLHSSIYKRLIKEFVTMAASRKITRVANVAPFGACFNSKTVGNTTAGPAVPTIDLVLQTESVYWRIHGANSMVKVKKNVWCLGVIDGGAMPRTSIVIGGHQLQDNFLLFDLASSKLQFSSSLLLLNTTCAGRSRIF